MITRLRDYPDPAELAAMYAKPHDHRRYGAGHDIRVRQTIQLADWFAGHMRAKTGADLSTGNAAIPSGVAGVSWLLGDFAPKYEIQGPIEETIEKIPRVDLFVCSETIEHVDDPLGLLRKIHAVARGLILSTPIGEVDGSGNPEHVWGWDQEGMGSLLGEAEWHTVARVDVVVDWSYSYQIYACLPVGHPLSRP